LVSDKALKMGVRAAVLCRDELAGEAARYLSSVSQQRCAPLASQSLPQGWTLFTGIKPVRRADELPKGLEALTVESVVEVIPAGGLRLGTRWAWVTGAPPRLKVAGLSAGDSVTVDGGRVAVSPEGEVDATDLLAQPGTHTVEAAGVTRRIEIVDPQPRNTVSTLASQGTSLALPPKSWTLIGATPGDVAQAVQCSRAGAIGICVFTAVWAVNVGAGPGATVICLQKSPPEPLVGGTRSRREAFGRNSVREWSSVIYAASIRRPQFKRLEGGEIGPEIGRAWASYMRAARLVKRRLSKSYR
jgi:hypothetical protein